ncbi:Drug resistance transporter EmrB/QacA subfamily [Acididesulfobacillus acetoxydans]|uniref:Drug resistance transporter EmrB/QacA subfamily n=1 Tax=Acididesulfobacillus acetoxydans TaxID=1561005 RepID=A0A8S0VVJ1_9FIRM|nr:DHA2 family efflux MFS transporter permease subunit [Acididesulfobacillus acetoxydans]CAA7599603.1 Drug resistance transporter EmrB/QacA subfamily [Acididesulfobacillus acetoxydans]CEJ06487.1 Lincomycin resistance protein LmrB [Acididesulfobacillus acetoxydans]
MSFEEKFGVPGLTVISVVLGVFMAILDSSVVNVAIPKMMAVFATTQNTISWVITVYLLATGMLTPVSGYLGDRFGYKKIYLIALVIFTSGSALCGAAWNVQAMIAFRVIQAVGGAMLMPISMSILFSLSKPEKRGAMMGIWGIAIMFAPAFGPTLSGYIVEYLDWRLIFYINVPVGIINLFMSYLYIPHFEPRPADKFDFPGFATSIIGFFCLLYALSDAPNVGWNSLEIISLLVASGVFLALFVVVELTTPNPMLDLRLLKIRKFLVSSASMSLLSMAMLGALFVLPVFLQNGLGLSPLQTGLLTMPGAIVTGFLMPVSGNLFDRFGARPVAVLGLAIMFLASLLLTNLNLQWSFLSIMLVYMIRSAGMGLSNMPISTAGMNAVPPPLISRATALQSTLRNVAGSIGTAVLSTMMQNHTNYAFNSYLQNVSNHAAGQISSFGVTPSVFGLTNPQQYLSLYLSLQQLAFQTGTQYALKISVVITSIALLAALTIGKKQQFSKSGEAPHVMAE